MPTHDDRSPLRLALVACRTRLGAAIAEVIARVPALEPLFILVCRHAAKDPGLVFGLCWAVHRRLSDVLRALGRQYRQVTIGPLRVWVDVADQSGFGVYFYGDMQEPLLTATLFQELHDGDVFVDVGANVGLFTMLAAKIVGPSGRVAAFEPHPGARADLRRLIERNEVADRVDVVPVALSDRAMNAVLHVTDRSGLSTLDPSTAPGRLYATFNDTIAVDAITLDEWMADRPALAPRIALMKIDVEGVEGRVVAGMPETLRRAVRMVIVCETAAGSDADRQLLDAGFSAVTLEPPDGGFVGNRMYSRATR